MSMAWAATWNRKSKRRNEREERAEADQEVKSTPRGEEAGGAARRREGTEIEGTPFLLLKIYSIEHGDPSLRSG